jgi:hypothetical protein
MFFLKQFNPEFTYDASILVFCGMILYVKYIALSEKHKIIDVPIVSPDFFEQIAGVGDKPKSF